MLGAVFFAGSSLGSSESFATTGFHFGNIFGMVTVSSACARSAVSMQLHNYHIGDFWVSINKKTCLVL